VWSLYQTASALGQRPSDLFGLPPDCIALRYDFDAAVVLFGRWAEGRMNERDDKGKPKRSAESVLRDPRWLAGIRPLDVRALRRSMGAADAAIGRSSPGIA
jgi:hypothetical protein